MSFIDDLIPLILEAHDHWWPRDLAALAAVSASWLFYVRKRLYACPTVSSYPAAALLNRSLVENPFLASLISGICLQPVIKNSSTRCHPSELKAARNLLGLEGLRHIALGGELAVNAERFLKFIAYPDLLQDIHVDGSLLGHRLSRCPSLEWDESLAFAFPELRRIRLTQIELEIIPPHNPYPSSISSLVVENVHIIHGHLSQLLNGAKVLDRLHITTTDAIGSDEEIHLVLASCAIGCLHYDMRKDSHANRLLLDASSESLQSLRCLHLDGLFVDVGVLTAVAEMCLNLVELVVSGRAVRVCPDEWVNFIRFGGLNSLRRLGLPWGTNIPPFRSWPPGDVEAIRVACASRKTPLTLW